ncbi:MAG: tRNA (guanine(9)-N(1))-methyltransferase [Peltula sp. TS41687]|nr:MAG: tRNA (guanine(9)-N(1))-methyltransferase [Peltula sp. TS41687]
MEAEGRPSKLRKLDHDQKTVSADSTPLDNQLTEPVYPPSAPNNDLDEPQPDDAATKAPDNQLAEPASSAPNNDLDEPQQDHAAAAAAAGAEQSSPSEQQPPLSKNQLKKLRRRQEWEDNREERKIRRKEKLSAKKARRREALQQEHEAPVEGEPSSVAAEDGGVAAVAHEEQQQQQQRQPRPAKHVKPTQLPITFILDCSFDELMTEKEKVSLATQLARCYSGNRNAAHRAHLIVSSFGGGLKHRFETVLNNHHRGWKGVKFTEEDYVSAAKEAQNRMLAPDSNRILAGALAGQQAAGSTKQEGEIIYLTSDSPDTLTELKPYNTYVVGALVDHNRHKGICYKRAMDREVQTAKLPIGEYLQMASRFVLTTNQVVEIMLNWLECGDWAQAFLKVVPKRKGGVLKTKAEKNGSSTKRGGEGEDRGQDERFPESKSDEGVYT